MEWTENGFPTRLTKLRQERHLSVDGLAKLVGVSRIAIHKWETGQSKPRLEHVLKLAKVLKVSGGLWQFGTEGNSSSPHTNRELDDFLIEARQIMQMIRRIVEQGERHIMLQKRLTAQLEDLNESAELASEVLAEFEDNLAAHRNNLTRQQAEPN